VYNAGDTCACVHLVCSVLGGAHRPWVLLAHRCLHCSEGDSDVHYP